MSSASEQSAVGAAAAAPAAAASAAASWPGSGEIGPGARMFHALINLVPASEARQIAATQDRMLKRLEATNCMLDAFNIECSEELALAMNRFQNHTRTLIQAKNDLHSIFRRIRDLRTRIDQQYPGARQRAMEERAAREAGEEHKSGEEDRLQTASSSDTAGSSPRAASAASNQVAGEAAGSATVDTTAPTEAGRDGDDASNTVPAADFPSPSDDDKSGGEMPSSIGPVGGTDAVAEAGEAIEADICEPARDEPTAVVADNGDEGDGDGDEEVSGDTSLHTPGGGVADADEQGDGDDDIAGEDDGGEEAERANDDAAGPVADDGAGDANGTSDGGAEKKKKKKKKRKA